MMLELSPGQLIVIVIRGSLDLFRFMTLVDFYDSPDCRYV